MCCCVCRCDRDYTPSTAEEKAYYDALFQVAVGAPSRTPLSGLRMEGLISVFALLLSCLLQDTQGQGQLFGQQAVMFLKTSGLDQSTLKNIWAVSETRGVHYLLREVG